MKNNSHISPVSFLPLGIPPGIVAGFVTVTLPYVLSQKGFTLVQTGTIVAVGVSAYVWKFLTAPVVELSLSLKKWYLLSILFIITSLLLLSFSAYNVNQQSMIALEVLFSMLSATLMLSALTGFLALSVNPDHKGRAAGWYQASNLAGTGLGGGAGLWLYVHHSLAVAGIVLCVVAALCTLTILLVQDVTRQKEKTIKSEIIEMGKSIFQMIKTPAVILVIFMIISPIGIGGASNLWSAIAMDWHTSSETVALVNGVLSGISGALGCVAGGYLMDKLGKWTGYLSAGVFCVLITFLMSIMPLQPYVFATGAMLYIFGVGMINAGFSAVILYAIGTKNAVTKGSLLGALGNIPNVYMTAFDGWSHDTYGSQNMLLIEAGAGILFVIIVVLLLRILKSKNLVPDIIE